MDLKELQRDKDIIRIKKMNEVKKGAPFGYTSKSSKENKADKSLTDEEINGLSEIQKELAINAMNLVDYDDDVILTGAFKKSVNENKSFLLLKEHVMKFDNIIADSRDGELLASLKEIELKKLGFDLEGTTEVLTFDSKIKKSNNKEMFNRYAKGQVKEHSVGMRYVKMFLCVNSEEPEWQEEKQNWEKYYESVINKEDLDIYFWAVTEAKFIEGSAVPFGANRFTPDLTITDKDKNNQKSNFDITQMM